MADPPTRFFKFVRPGFLFNLSIPRSFMMNLNGVRCSKAILRRGCHEWLVDIDNEVFGNGWRKFVRENGVQEFDFIVFKHQGSMVFDFSVFDESSCEKDYPNLFDEMEEEEHLTEADTIRTHRKLGASNWEYFVFDNHSVYEMLIKGAKKLKKRKRNDYASQDQEKFQVGDDSGCFMSKMTPYAINKSRLHVPMKFARSNGLITQRIYTQVYLEDDTQRSWPATLQKGKLELCLTGWHEFKVKNHLKVGDVCKFELVKHGEVPVFKCSNLGKNFVKNHKQVKETSSSHDLNSHPYFIANLRPTSFKRSALYIPVHFSKPNGLKPGEMILRDEKGRSWKVQLNIQCGRSFYLGQGFRAFLVANGMKEGDAFKFDLLEKEKTKPPIVNFFLLRSKLINSRKEANLTRKEGSILCEEDGRPCFVGEIKSSSIKQPVLHVPMEFARSNGLITQRIYTQVYLIDDTQRSWPATLQKGKLELCLTGWHDFRVKNHLEVGDVCRFELVKDGEVPVFKISNIGKNSLKNHIQVKETSSSRNNHPHFISNLTCTSFKRCVLYLPTDFSITNGLKTGEMILRDDKGRSWKVHVRKLKWNQFYIGSGFRVFLVANGMKKGDEFKFELVEKEKDKPPIVNFFFLKSKPIKSHKKAKFTRKEGSIRCEEDGLPYFVGELKSCSIKQSLLYLPLGFAKSNGLINNKKMTLKNVEDERLWPVELKNHKHRFYYIGRGWTDFRVAYGLKEGDHFKFKLVKKGEIPIVNFYFQKSVEATTLPRQNKIEKVLKKTRLEGASSSDTLQMNELEVPLRATRERRGHIRGVGHKLKSVSIDDQPPPPVPMKDMWSKKKFEKQMGKMRDKMYEDFNASLQVLQEQHAQFIRSHSSNYQPPPPIQINCNPNQFLEDEDGESDD